MDNIYELVVSDADTPLFQAAKSVEEDYIEVTCTKTGVMKEFKNRTEFYGHFKKKEGGWLGNLNNFLGLSIDPNDDFTIEECVRLREGIDHLKEAEKSFDYHVGRIKRYPADDYQLILGGTKENFRYAVAMQVPYKGERKTKPLMFTEIRELILEKYKSKIILAEGEEADDVCGKLGWANFLNYRKTGKWKMMLTFIDKDLKMILSPYAIYSEKGETVTIPSPPECAMAFCSQMLSGDKSTDNILGLPNFSETIKKKYNLGNVRGIGKATALSYLEGCTSISEMFSRVAEAYKSYYGEDAVEFESHRGEELLWNWKDYMTENSILLYMRREDNEVYDIFKAMDRLGVKYE